MRPGGLAGACAVGVGLTVFALESARAPAQELTASDAAPVPVDARADRRAGAMTGIEAPPDESLTVTIVRPQRAAPTPVSGRVGARAESPTGGRAASPGRGTTQAAPRRLPPPPPRSSSARRYRSSRYSVPIPTPAEWEPPAGPVRIALQAGHWRADEAPRELRGLRDNGTSWRGTAEWEVNLAIARRAAAMLEDVGYEVDVLPAIVPPSYRSHLFVAIHADGSDDGGASGFRVASPRRDATGRASRFASLLERSYGAATDIRRLPTVTRRMRNYYAFNYRRYRHALHPMTIGVILETGFLTSMRDRRVIVDAPERAARGIVDAILAFPETPPPAAAGR